MKRQTCAPGSARYGWAWEGHQLVRNEVEQSALAAMLEWRRQGRTFQWIADQLNAAGILTRQGRIWNRSTIRQRILRAQDPEQYPVPD